MHKNLHEHRSYIFWVMKICFYISYYVKCQQNLHKFLRYGQLKLIALLAPHRPEAYSGYQWHWLNLHKNMILKTILMKGTSHMLHRFGIKSFGKLHKIFRQYVVYAACFHWPFLPFSVFFVTGICISWACGSKARYDYSFSLICYLFSNYGAHFLRCWNWAYLPAISSPPYDRKLHKIVFWSVWPYSFYSSQLAGLPSYDLWKQIWTSSVELKSSCDCLMAT